jgi:hypothetical protein
MRDPAVGDSITYHNFQAVNETNHALPDIGVWEPYIWARIPTPNGKSVDHFDALTWNNDLHGWSSSNFNGTGESVLVTLQITTNPDGPDTQLAAGSVADGTGTNLFPEQSNLLHDDSGNIIFPNPPYQVETLQPGYQLPFVDLGSFQPNEKEPFDLTFTYHWGGRDLGAYRTAGYIATLAPDQIDNGHHSPGTVQSEALWA